MPKTLKDMAEELLGDVRHQVDHVNLGTHAKVTDLEQLVRIVHAHLLEHEILDPHRGA